MIDVILKELRQMLHGAKLPVVAAAFTVAALALGISRQFVSIKELYFYFFHLPLYIYIVVLIARAAHQWKKERGDTALDMTLTTTLPVWQVIFGKFIALYLPVLALLLIDRVVDFQQIETTLFRERLLKDIAFFAALSSFMPALSSIRTKRSGFELGEIAAYLIAIPWIICHLFITPFFGSALPLYQAVSLGIGFAITGFLIAFAGLRKPSEDRMRDLHLYFIAAAWIMPVIFWYFGDESWKPLQTRELFICSTLFLFASLFERDEVTRREKSSWSFPFFSTGSVIAWGLSIAVLAPVFFIAEHTEDFQKSIAKWCYAGLYVALVRCIGRKWSPIYRALAFWGLFLLVILASALASQIDTIFACCGMVYFDYYQFSAPFFGCVFALSVLLRIREICRFVNSCRA